MENFISMLHDLNVLSIIVRLVLAIVAGGVIGFERGKHGRAAGLRTHILIAVGSAMASMIDVYVCSLGVGSGGDPGRIPAQVLSGIGFLGAGIILIKNKSKVTGLTTAAAMWATSTVGMAFGSGFYLGGLIATVAIFLTLSLMTVFEAKQKKDRVYLIEIDDVSVTNQVVKVLKETFPKSHDLSVGPSKSGLPNHVIISINIMVDKSSIDVTEQLLNLAHVVFAVEE